jgi:hypothetical protein
MARACQMPYAPSLINCPVYLICPETLVDGLHSLVPIGAHMQTAHFELTSADKGVPCETADRGAVAARW